jgi:hypothetical protein
MARKKKVCPQCGKVFMIDTEDLSGSPPDPLCLPCLELGHIYFMRNTGRKMGFTCAAGCICGNGEDVESLYQDIVEYEQ